MYILAFGVLEYPLGARRTAVMTKALLPNGKEIYACERQHITICVEDKNLAKQIEKALRKHLKDDPRYLRIEIQSQKELQCWHACIRWGDAIESRDYPRLIFTRNEQTPRAVISRILEELNPMQFSSIQEISSEQPILDLVADS